MVGKHLVKSWSSTRPTITLSSGEAELHGVVRAAANGLGYLSLLSDLGIRTRLRIWTDSSASRGMCARQGLGKVRHLDVQELWIQQRIRNGDFDLFKVPGESNPGDLFTKASLTDQRIRSLIDILGCEFKEGRARSAPALRQEGGTRTLSLVAQQATQHQHVPIPPRAAADSSRHVPPTSRAFAPLHPSRLVSPAPWVSAQP